MAIIDSFIGELQQESAGTRKTLERVPGDKLGWQPHAKSFTMGRLASHLSEVPSWVVPAMTAQELNFDKSSWKPFEAKSTAELVAHFDEGLAKALEVMKGFPDERMMELWALKANGQEIFKMPRTAVLRGMVLNHMIHHRAQLGVYLRLNDIAVPSIYGPSADEM